MPERKTLERARRDKRAGKSPSTQAGKFVKEEIEHVREGKHGARSTKQAIAIGLSKARRAGVDLKPPKKGQAKRRTRKSAEDAYDAAQAPRHGRRPKAAEEGAGQAPHAQERRVRQRGRPGPAQDAAPPAGGARG